MTLGLGTPLASAEALVAKHRIHLAAEPEGKRSGVALPYPRSKGDEDADSEQGRVAAQPSAAAVNDSANGEVKRAVTLCAIGDSMVAGCGTSNQRDGFIPAIAAQLAAVSGRAINWQAHGKLGATMRRVRYRLAPSVQGRFDIVVVCAGSNDIMANRGLDEWRADLDATLGAVCQMSETVLVLSPGQMQHEPSLGKALRRQLLVEMDRQAAVSQEVCAAHSAQYVNMIHADVQAGRPGFFSDDHFHPSAEGYRLMAHGVVAALGEDFAQRVAAM